MQNQKDGAPPATEQTGERNPTLDAPGSKVADYGNPAGGSANETVEGMEQPAGGHAERMPDKE